MRLSHGLESGLESHIIVYYWILILEISICIRHEEYRALTQSNVICNRMIITAELGYVMNHVEDSR